MPKRRKARTTVIAITSDQHCGSTVALCPPVITLDDGGEYHASKAQRWLWDCWQDYWRQVAAIRDEHDATLYQVFNGDLVDGAHHGTTQILSEHPGVQMLVAREALGVPLALTPDRLFFVRGTEVHVGKNASAEESMAAGLRRDGWAVEGCAETGTASRWHLRMQVDGLRLDIAHHGRVGTRPWTKPNVVMNLAAEVFYQHAAAGLPHPHLAVRSHMHQFLDTHDAHPTRLIQLPAWQLATAFIHRIAPGALADVGGIVVVIRDGTLEVRPIRYAATPTPVWSPT
jgi:hypothetical protein